MCRLIMTMLMLYPIISLAQTCNVNIVATTPTIQFTDHGNGTVTDNKTGLMWMRCAWGQGGDNCETGSIGYYTWKEALQIPVKLHAGKGFAGYTDWRLPNKNELISIVEQQCFNPAINLEVFPEIVSVVDKIIGRFWSSTPYAVGAQYFSFFAEFYDGFNYYANRKMTHSVRLVRDAR